MNADLLLQHFNRISEAPDAVARLRRFILDLAVRGKLVSQNPKDEPAAALFKRMRMERQTDFDAKKKGTGSSISGETDTFFPVPAGWLWLRFGAVHELVRGVTYTKSDVAEAQSSGYLPILRANNIGATLSFDNPVFVREECVSPEQMLHRGDYLIALSSGSKNLVGKAAHVDAEYAYGFGGFCGVIRLISTAIEQFVGVFLSSRLYRDAISAGSRGIGINNLKRETLNEILFPLPPLPEQQRIVAKVDELMALCDQLEAAKTEREGRRDRLVAASLNRIGTAPADELPAVARFHLAQLPRLTTRIEHVKELRQTILNLAVRGRLVPQDPKDEPASELLLRIAKERARLGLKHEASPLDSDEMPFVLPQGWSWSRIGEVCSKTGSGSTPRGGRAVYKSVGIPFLRSQNVYDDGLRLEDVAYIDPSTHARMGATAVKPGDLLLNITGGSMGRCCRVPDKFDEANVSQHVAIVRTAVRGMEDFLHRLVLSPYFQAFIFDEQTGAGRGGLPKNRMDHIAVALPPVPEQHRIVAKVDQLMAVCDKLETQLIATQTDSRRLLEAVLRDTLTPALAEAA